MLFAWHKIRSPPTIDACCRYAALVGGFLKFFRRDFFVGEWLLFVDELVVRIDVFSDTVWSFLEVASVDRIPHSLNFAVYLLRVDGEVSRFASALWDFEQLDPGR